MKAVKDMNDIELAFEYRELRESQAWLNDNHDRFIQDEAELRDRALKINQERRN